MNSNMICVRSGDSISLKLKSKSLSVSPMRQSIVFTRDEINCQIQRKGVKKMSELKIGPDPINSNLADQENGFLCCSSQTRTQSFSTYGTGWPLAIDITEGLPEVGFCIWSVKRELETLVLLPFYFGISSLVAVESQANRVDISNKTITLHGHQRLQDSHYERHAKRI